MIWCFRGLNAACRHQQSKRVIKILPHLWLNNAPFAETSLPSTFHGSCLACGHNPVGVTMPQLSMNMPWKLIGTQSNSTSLLYLENACWLIIFTADWLTHVEINGGDGLSRFYLIFAHITPLAHIERFAASSYRKRKCLEVWWYGASADWMPYVDFK